jgi:hypothetical protein
MAVGGARPAVRLENRSGAGSNIATETVVRAPADGYTLLLASTPNRVNTTLYERLNFDFIRDLAPVAGIMVVPNVMVVHPSFPAKTLPEFISYVEANPGKVNMASAGKGSASHEANGSMVLAYRLPPPAHRRMLSLPSTGELIWEGSKSWASITKGAARSSKARHWGQVRSPASV